MGTAVGRPGAGARHATQPAPGTAAGGRAIRGSASTMAQHGTLADNNDTRLGGGQDNGELSDVTQKHRQGIYRQSRKTSYLSGDSFPTNVS